MLKRAHRLPSSVRLAQSTSIRFQYVTVKYQTTQQEASRVGVVISKRVSPKAIERNRLKRLIHTFLFEQIPLWKQSTDMLILVHPGTAALANDVFAKSLKDSFQKLSL